MSVLSIRQPCPELAVVAQKELNETPKKLEEGILYLKKWIAKQPHLRARTDDQWLAAFLRGCKHSLERAKEKLDVYYMLRSIAPEMTALKYWDPKFKEILKSGGSIILPKRKQPADPRVVLVRASSYNPDKFTPLDFFAFTHILQMITCMEDDAFIIAGCIFVFDFAGVKIDHIKQITPSFLKKSIIFNQDGAPIRLKSAHILGMPSYFQAMFNIGKQLLNETNKQKIHMHNGDYTSLYKYVSKDILPVEYGGNGGTIQEIIDDWMKKLSEYEPFLEEDLKFGTDESKRFGKSRTAESLLGIDGSFRQLDFD